MAEHQSERVGLAGRVGSDIKRSMSRDGEHKVASFRFAVDQGQRNDAGGWEKTGTIWHTVWARDQLAEQVYKNVRKGQEVVVLGYLNRGSYKANDGTEKESLDISASAVAISVRGVEIEVHRPHPLGIEGGPGLDR